MKQVIQFHIYKGEKYYVAEGADFPVVTQGVTLDELASNVREAVALQLEGEDPADFNLVQNPATILNMELVTAG